ncbi:hypothetical protein RMCBS344292_01506 [Rhizopus microsporus]|nr:hypothetical protein RMCBS344292_01506 [Rhizopus microsporus]
MKRFKFHLELRNKYKALENTDECKEEAQKIVSKYSSEESDAKSFLQLPSSMAIKSGDIDIGSGYYNVRRKLEKAKSTEGKAVQEIEDKFAKLDMKYATSAKQAMKIYQQHVDNRIAFRNFYHSKKRVRLKRTCEIENDRFRRRLCAKERTLLIDKKDNPIHRKTIKDKEIKTKVKGSFLCRNPDCVLVSNKKAVKPRDDLSVLAIGLSGLCSLLFQETFPELSAKISHCNTDFINKTASFLNERECWDIGLDTINRGKSKTFEKNGY